MYFDKEKFEQETIQNKSQSWYKNVDENVKLKKLNNSLYRYVGENYSITVMNTWCNKLPLSKRK